MSDEKTVDRTGGVPRSDADVANSGAAPWTNRVIVTMGPMVRIAFLEQGAPDEPMYFRAAASMSHQDAIALKNLLTGLLADVEKQIDAALHQPKVQEPSPMARRRIIRVKGQPVVIDDGASETAVRWRQQLSNNVRGQTG